MKALFLVLFVLLLPVPVFAKPYGFYPVSCDDLWTAVNQTLSDSGNYGVIMADDPNKRASLVIVGSMVVFKDRVALKAMGSGCQMNLTFTQIGPDNSDERGFKKRVEKSLAKLQAAKLAAATKLPAAPAGSH